MIIVYEIYLDIFFLDNMLTNLLVLSSTKLLIGGKIKPLFTVAAAGLGTVISVGILYFGVSYGVLYLAVVMAGDMTMLHIMGIYGRKVLIGLIYMNAIAFALAKLTSSFTRLAGSSVSPLLTSALTIILITAVLIYDKVVRKRAIYECILKNNDTLIEVKALYDSGNLLKDPISGRPVSIMEKTDMLAKWIKNAPERYKAIPYKSVGNNNGMLSGMMIDQLIILSDNEQVVEDNAIIALYEGSLSGNGKFQMILNHDLL